LRYFKSVPINTKASRRIATETAYQLAKSFYDQRHYEKAKEILEQNLSMTLSFLESMMDKVRLYFTLTWLIDIYKKSQDSPAKIAQLTDITHSSTLWLENSTVAGLTHKRLFPNATDIQNAKTLIEQLRFNQAEAMTAINELEMALNEIQQSSPFLRELPSPAIMPQPALQHHYFTPLPTQDSTNKLLSELRNLTFK